MARVNGTAGAKPVSRSHAHQALDAFLNAKKPDHKRQGFQELLGCIAPRLPDSMRPEPPSPEEQARDVRYKAWEALYYAPIPVDQRDRARKHMYNASKIFQVIIAASREDLSGDEDLDRLQTNLEHLGRRALELLSAAAHALNADHVVLIEETELESEQRMYARRLDGQPEDETEEAAQ